MTANTLTKNFVLFFSGALMKACLLLMFQIKKKNFNRNALKCLFLNFVAEMKSTTGYNSKEWWQC